MNVIELTRQVGKALQEDERYKRYHEAKKKNDEDTELQQDISEFHAIKMMINMEEGKADCDRERVKKLNSDLTAMFTKVTQNPNMIAYEEARSAMDELLASVNYIVTASANGQDPMTVSETPPSACSPGGCAGCSGCG